MDDRHTFTRRRLLAGTAASLALVATGVRAAAAPKELRIGFQKGSLNLLLLKQRGLLEQRLPDTRVSWTEFPAGPQLLEGLAVGSIDFGATGDSPPVFAQAAGKDLLYVGAEPPKPDSSALLVRQDSGLNALADLKGRKIALQKGSSAHYLLVQIVRKAGLQWSDITPVYLAPADARAAFERGSVDGWVIWDPYYAAAEVGGGVRVLVTSRGLTGNHTFYLAARGFASRHPGTLTVLFDGLTEADAYAQAHRQETAQLYAQVTGLPEDTVLRVLARRNPSPVAPLTPELVAEQQRVADAFRELGLIPRRIEVAQAVWQPAGNPAAHRAG